MLFIEVQEPFGGTAPALKSIIRQMANTLKRWLIWLLIITFLWLVGSRFAEIEHLADTLASGQWQWIWAAIFIQVIYYFNLAALYRSAFDTVGVKANIRDLVPVTFASLFVNVAVPTAGASGAALFVDDATRRGQSATKAAAGTLLVVVVSFSSVLAVLVVGMTYLFVQQNLRLYQIFAAVFLLVAILLQVNLLAMGLGQPEWMRGLLTQIQKFVNELAVQLKRPAFLELDWAAITADEFNDRSACHHYLPLTPWTHLGDCFNGACLKPGLFVHTFSSLSPDR